MSNIIDNNYRTLRLRVDKSYYWDFFINKDRCHFYRADVDNGLSAMIDWSMDECVEDGWAISLSGYSWEYAVNNGVEMKNIGYTGIDNGLITYRRDRILNSDFVDIFQNSTYSIESGDTRLRLHPVSGTTLQYDYPLHVENGEAVFNGGFYQGFFKTDCDEYYILPSNLGYGDEWNLEFLLNKCEMEPESDKTLNSKYPDNKGIFFYIGTRAENKWVYLYNKEEEGDECEEIGVGDYVEGGDIDRNTYIINNFFDLDPEFEWTEEDERKWFINDWYEYSDENDKYTDFSYYDWSLYNVVSVDGVDDYLDFEDSKPVIIDHNADHIIIGKCEKPCTIDRNTDTSTYKYIKVPFVSCGCGRGYKKVKVKNDGTYTDPEPYTVLPGDDFGDDYISGFDGLDCDYDYLEPEVDISNFSYSTDNGFELDIKDQYYFYTDNKFILFDRTRDGYNVSNWVEGTKMMYYGTKNKFKGNLFILMNRTKTGFTVNNIREYMEAESESIPYDTYSDLYGNAFALQINDNGAIGYRMLAVDCELSGENKCSVVSGMSHDNIISDCDWHLVHVRIIGLVNSMKIMFYVDGKLVFITKELPKLNLRKLNDLDEKQEGVPFNISIGGGTQGLAETITGNYMDNPYRVYPIERSFAGSFIGRMKAFSFYVDTFDFGRISNNFKRVYKVLENNTYL